MKEGMIIFVCVDDCLIVADSMARIDVLIHSLQHGPEKFILMEEVIIEKFFGISITQLDCIWFKLSEPFLIKCIIKFIDTEYKLEVNGNVSSTPVGKPLLQKEVEGEL